MSTVEKHSPWEVVDTIAKERDRLAENLRVAREAQNKERSYVIDFIKRWDKNDPGDEVFPMSHEFTVSLGNLRWIADGRAAKELADALARLNESKCKP